MAPSPRSGRLGFKLLANQMHGLAQRAGTKPEGALDEAGLAADVARHVEDRGLTLPEGTHHPEGQCQRDEGLAGQAASYPLL